MERIVLVEDNPDWLELASSELRKECPAYEIELITTESQFRNRLVDWETDPPRLFIIDIMLPWAEPAKEMPEAPEEVKSNSYARAGLRCHRELMKSERLLNVPVVFWTIVALADLREDVRLTKSVAYVPKEEHLAGLIRRVRDILRG